MPPLQLVAKTQSQDFSCGAVCLEVALDYLGVRTRTVPSTPIDGTAPDTLEAALWQSGVRVQSGSMDLADLKHHTGMGRPVICLVTEGDVGHWVVVGGIHRGRVEFVDPLVGHRKEPVTEFARRWASGDSTRRGVNYTNWAIAVSL